MYNMGVHVEEGDYFTFIGKGEIWYRSQRGRSSRPSGSDYRLLYRIGKEPPVDRYFGGTIFGGGMLKADRAGDLYLGFDDGGVYPNGEARYPQNYRDNSGYFVIDILVWRTYDLPLIIDFLEKASLDIPNDSDLERITSDISGVKDILRAQERATEDVDKANEAISSLKGEEVQDKKPTVVEAPKVPELSAKAQAQANATQGLEKIATAVEESKIPEVSQKLQEEAKAAIESVEQKEKAGIRDEEKERKIADLNEKLQRALQSLKDLEELKSRLTEQQQKEKELVARVQLLEEKEKQSKSVPIIAIVNPTDGVTVESECIPLSGVAEHQRGITKFEILLNNIAISPKDSRLIKVTPKEQKRIEFSERICLREGKNEITVIAEDSEGALSQKTVSVQLSKRMGELWAVVIGINKYKNLASLKYAANDAQEFYRYLVEVNKIPKENIWLLLDEEATLEQIKSILGTRLRRSAGKEDMVIVYLAGHGAIEGDSASPDGDGLEKYILPYNADPKDLYSSALPMGEIARVFQRISSERLVFITDTCYSGATGGRTVPVPGVRTNISGAFLERISQGSGRVVLTASDANEVTVERDELRHGVFTYYLLEGLRGKADLDGNGVITVDEVYRYVSIKVPQATGQGQHPVRKGETKGEMVLGVLK
jgi:hypothetical protein